jgi:hypothetical protein
MVIIMTLHVWRCYSIAEQSLKKLCPCVQCVGIKPIDFFLFSLLTESETASRMQLKINDGQHM